MIAFRPVTDGRHRPRPSSFPLPPCSFGFGAYDSLEIHVCEIKSRPGRATLTLLSIVIGVAAVVAVTVSTATTNQACRDMYVNVAGRAAFEVVGDGDSYFPEGIADQIEKAPV